MSNFRQFSSQHDSWVVNYDCSLTAGFDNTKKLKKNVMIIYTERALSFLSLVALKTYPDINLYLGIRQTGETHSDRGTLTSA